MNLIEQLGGYKRAKDGLHRLKLEKKDLLTCGDLVVVESEIDAALIEYRRQHNIFEEGDKAVFVDDFMHDELMVVAWTREGEVWMDEGAKRCTDLSMIRHATDAEIKACKRLEVNDGST